jgi:hypothetical protein
MRVTALRSAVRYLILESDPDGPGRITPLLTGRRHRQHCLIKHVARLHLCGRFIYDR